MILFGDALTELKTLDEESVQTCVTSPPYWGLRSYLDDSDPLKEYEIGCEPTPEAYVEKLVLVFREVRRVLRSDGTLWVNIGDTYASPPPGNKIDRVDRVNGGLHSAPRSKGRVMNTVVGDLKDKDLVGIPWMLALALRRDGWWLRADVIWNKLQNLPESVQDRPTKAHEYVFLFSKNARYVYDRMAVPEASRTVWDVVTKHQASQHTATYPIELPTRCILCSTKPNDVVLDPFAGSGTTLAAAVNLRRQYVGVELNRNCEPELQSMIDQASQYAHQAEAFDAMSSL